jgi:hypothetical protein
MGCFEEKNDVIRFAFHIYSTVSVGREMEGLMTETVIGDRGSAPNNKGQWSGLGSQQGECTEVEGHFC